MNRRGVTVVAVLALAAVAGCSAPSAPGQAGPTGTEQATPTAEPSCACSSYPPTPPAGAVSRDAAIATALRAVPGAGATTQVLWADVYPDPFASHLVPPGGTPLPESYRQVWMVRLEGTLAIPTCPGDTMPTTPASSSEGPCLDSGGGVDVVLDIMTGALLGWTH